MKKVFKFLLYQFFPSEYKKWKYKNINLNSLDYLIQKNIEPELFLLKKFLKDENSVFIDIGANSGLYIFAAEKLINQSNIFAFEPNPKLITQIEHLFKQVNTYKIALSDSKGTFDFKIPYINNQKIATRGTLNIDFKEDKEHKSEIIKVQTKRLDDLIAIQELNRIDLIKIDVEGFEIFTLKGAEKTIQKYKPVLFVEIEQRHHNSSSLNECIKMACPKNYSVFYLDRNTKKIEKYNENKDYQSVKILSDKLNYINNFVFIPD